MSPFLPQVGLVVGVNLHLPTWCVWHVYYCVHVYTLYIKSVYLHCVPDVYLCGLCDVGDV